ncbi:hypothetical protein VP01_666g3 [Puccinia sorghi]|uniref:Uncharacterized protein n=1 Tax=Puccinia sorghi TaxID=27349 RepID=A0A0L6UEW2_9BASI|nr:hypothetical protein VP01_666g3 [Puccinia sorghi]
MVNRKTRVVFTCRTTAKLRLDSGRMRADRGDRLGTRFSIGGPGGLNCGGTPDFSKYMSPFFWGAFLKTVCSDSKNHSPPRNSYHNNQNHHPKKPYTTPTLLYYPIIHQHFKSTHSSRLKLSSELTTKSKKVPPIMKMELLPKIGLENKILLKLIESILEKKEDTKICIYTITTYSYLYKWIVESIVGVWFCFSRHYHNCWCLLYYHLHSSPSVLSTVISTLDMDIRDVGSIPTGHIFFSEFHINMTNSRKAIEQFDSCSMIFPEEIPTAPQDSYIYSGTHNPRHQIHQIYTAAPGIIIGSSFYKPLQCPKSLPIFSQTILRLALRFYTLIAPEDKVPQIPPSSNQLEEALPCLQICWNYPIEVFLGIKMATTPFEPPCSVSLSLSLSLGFIYSSLPSQSFAPLPRTPPHYLVFLIKMIIPHRLFPIDRRILSPDCIPRPYIRPHYNLSRNPDLVVNQIRHSQIYPLFPITSPSSSFEYPKPPSSNRLPWHKVQQSEQDSAPVLNSQLSLRINVTRSVENITWSFLHDLIHGLANWFETKVSFTLNYDWCSFHDRQNVYQRTSESSHQPLCRFLVFCTRDLSRDYLCLNSHMMSMMRVNKRGAVKQESSSMKHGTTPLEETVSSLKKKTYWKLVGQWSGFFHSSLHETCSYDWAGWKAYKAFFILKCTDNLQNCSRVRLQIGVYRKVACSSHVGVISFYRFPRQFLTAAIIGDSRPAKLFSCNVRRFIFILSFGFQGGKKDAKIKIDEA